MYLLGGAKETGLTPSELQFGCCSRDTSLGIGVSFIFLDMTALKMNSAASALRFYLYIY